MISYETFIKGRGSIANVTALRYIFFYRKLVFSLDNYMTSSLRFYSLQCNFPNTVCMKEIASL